MERFQPPQEPQLVEKIIEKENPYQDSNLIEKVKATKKVAFVDIDSTITSSDPEIQLQARQKLEAQGYAVVFVTARTYEMQISDQERQMSPDLVRPSAQMARNQESGKLTAVDPESLTGMKGLLDPDAIVDSTGTHIAIRQKEGGYKADRQYVEKMKMESAEWRNFSQRLVDIINAEKEVCTVKPFEKVGAYEAGETDVYLPDFRMQIEFSDLEKKQTFVAKVKELMLQSRETITSQHDDNFYTMLHHLRLTDESKPSSNIYSLYLMPKSGTKQRSVEAIVRNITEATNLPREELELLIVGDGFPDLAMGLYGGLNTKATFLVVGGSRLTPALTEPDISEFAGEGFRSIKNRMIAQGEGFYSFKPPLYQKRQIIIGDQAFPGTKAPKTIIAYLDSQSTKT